MKFTELKIKPAILEAIADSKYLKMTDIQQLTIPKLLEKNIDIIAQAPTGTGKTCAFVVPSLQKVDGSLNHTQVLVMCPTREIAIQTGNEFKKLAKNLDGITVASIYGGQPINKQITLIKKSYPQIVVGTPGRILDHLKRKTLSLYKVTTLVLDEADEMLSMGFKNDMLSIMKSIGIEHNTILFSATMTKEVTAMSKTIQKNPEFYRAELTKENTPSIKQYYVKVPENIKANVIVDIIKQNKYYLNIVFSNTKHKAKRLVRTFIALGINAGTLHSDLRQNVRDKIMMKFRKGEIQMLIATDIAARGIDVSDISAVFNIDVPKDLNYYIHRIGRTARAKKSGDAYTFVSNDFKSQIRNIENITKDKLTPFEVDMSKYKDIVVENDQKSFDRPFRPRQFDGNKLRRKFSPNNRFDNKPHGDRPDRGDRPNHGRFDRNNKSGFDNNFKKRSFDDRSGSNETTREPNSSFSYKDSSGKFGQSRFQSSGFKPGFSKKPGGSGHFQKRDGFKPRFSKECGFGKRDDFKPRTPREDGFKRNDRKPFNKSRTPRFSKES